MWTRIEEKEKKPVQYKISNAFHNLLMSKDPLNPPTVSTYF